MLKFVAPQNTAPHDVLMISRPGCSFCAKAKKLLQDRGMEFDEVPASPRRLRAASGKTSTPQIFIDGKYIGGADELEKYLAANK